MREWLFVQQLSAACGRRHVLKCALTTRLASVSAVALAGVIAAGGVALALAALTLEGAWAAGAALAGTVLAGLLAGVILEDRLVTTLQSRPAALHLPGVVRRYRRGLLGARYVLFLEQLRATDAFTATTLERALRCCDAEIAMLRQGRPRARTGPAVTLAAAAAGLLLAAPWLTPHGLDGVGRLAGLAGAIAALLLIAWRSAQPASPAPDETRTLLVWALEEARARP